MLEQTVSIKWCLRKQPSSVVLMDTELKVQYNRFSMANSQITGSAVYRI